MYSSMIQKFTYLVVGLALGLVFIPKGSSPSQPTILGTSTHPSQDVRPAPELLGAVEPPRLTASAALAYDWATGSTLYTHNFDQALPIASLTKLMTALVVVQSANVDEVVVIESSDTKAVGSSMGLVPGERMTIRNLLYGLLVPSSNDAALALARVSGGSTEQFIARMNEQADTLGMVDTHFANPVGWDDADNFSTARDLSILAREFLGHALLSEIVNTRELTVVSADGRFEHALTSTNQLLLEDPRVNGIKTGLTSQAKGNLIIRIAADKQEIITIVLGSDNREEDSRQLMDWVLGSYRW